MKVEFPELYCIMLVFILICSVWLVFELWLNIHDRAKVGKPADKKTGIYLSVLIAAAIGISIIVQNTDTPRIPVTPGFRLLMGTIIVITGAFIRWWAVWYLGKYFQTVAAVQDGQKLLKSGPYRYIRHPSYTGAMLVFLGFGLGLGTWIGLAVMLVFPFLGYYRRIKLEEQLMITHFQSEYMSLIAETKKLIPFIY